MVILVVDSGVHILEYKSTSTSVCGEDIDTDKTRYKYNKRYPYSEKEWSEINKENLCLDCYGSYLLEHSQLIWWYRASCDDGDVYSPVKTSSLKDHEEIQMEKWLATDEEPWDNPNRSDTYMWLFEDLDVIRIDEMVKEFYDKSYSCEEILRDDTIPANPMLSFYS